METVPRNVYFNCVLAEKSKKIKIPHGESFWK